MSETTDRQTHMFSLIEECHQGTLTRKEFCKHHSISHNCFYYWQKKYRQQNQPKEISAGLSGSVPAMVAANGQWLDRRSF